MTPAEVDSQENELGPIERALEQLFRLNASRKVLNRRAAAAGVVISQPGFQLLRRIQEGSTLPIAYPCVPRGYDAGFYGYNRPGGIGGPLQQRVQELAATIYSADAMRKAAGAQFIDRCRPVDLQPPDWQVQRRIDVDGAAAAR